MIRLLFQIDDTDDYSVFDNLLNLQQLLLFRLLHCKLSFHSLLWTSSTSGFSTTTVAFTTPNAAENIFPRHGKIKLEIIIYYRLSPFVCLFVFKERSDIFLMVHQMLRILILIGLLIITASLPNSSIAWRKRSTPVLCF